MRVDATASDFINPYQPHQPISTSSTHINLIKISNLPFFIVFFVFFISIDYSVLWCPAQQWLNSFFIWINIISRNA